MYHEFTITLYYIYLYLVITIFYGSYNTLSFVKCNTSAHFLISIKRKKLGGKYTFISSTFFPVTYPNLKLIVLDRVKLDVIEVKLYEITVLPFLKENEFVYRTWKWLNISRILHKIYSGVINCFHTLYIGLLNNKYNPNFEFMDYVCKKKKRSRIKFCKR